MNGVVACLRLLVKRESELGDVSAGTTFARCDYFFEYIDCNPMLRTSGSLERLKQALAAGSTASYARATPLKLSRDGRRRDVALFRVRQLTCSSDQ